MKAQRIVLFLLAVIIWESKVFFENLIFTCGARMCKHGPGE